MPVVTTLPNPASHEISLQTAIAMTTLYRAKRELILASGYQDKNIWNG